MRALLAGLVLLAFAGILAAPAAALPGPPFEPACLPDGTTLFCLRCGYVEVGPWHVHIGMPCLT